MSETKNPGDSTLGVPSKSKTLTLKRSGSFDKGAMRQSVGQGRSKSAVVVEKKRRRIVKPGAAGEAPETHRPARQQPQASPEAKPRAEQVRVEEKKGDAKSRTGVVLRTLTDEERGARAAALAEARVREQEERRVAEERARIESEEAERRAREAEEAARRRAEEDSRRETETKVREKTEREARERLVEPAPAPAPAATSAPAPRPARGREVSLEEASREAERLKRAKPADQKSPKRGGDDRRRGKLTVTAALSSEGAEERGRSLASMRRRREREKRQLSDMGPREKIAREVVLPETITIQELANRMAERAVDVIKLLMKQGQMLKINDVIDADTAELIASEMGHTVKRVSEADVEEGLFGEPDTDEEGQPRPPVVTIMGHVDHGKTSLLDALREANVVSGEAGGITQHIGAYQVEHEGAKTTFIDTPGHEAFTAMRARGAKVTDIVILVVAADDSVMPQTVEAINHAKAAEVPIIVAINKIDKPEADPQKVRTELLQHEIVVESLSGDVQDVEVSALKKQGLDTLLEAIALQAEILELKANPDRPAEGVVIEAKLDKGRGPVGTVLVQRGTLKKGDIIVAGNQWAKVRALIDDHGNTVEDAPPATPVEVLGFTGAPAAGDRFAVVESEARAREITEYRQRQEREKAVATGAGARGSLEQMMSQLRETGLAEFPLVIKSDVQGSAEAIAQALEKLNTDEVAARILMSGVGGITESDISLAATSNAAIIGFNVRANKQAREAADQDGIEIRYYNVIYDLVDDIKQAMSGLLAPEQRETFLGNAEILQIFKVSKVGSVAGCRVTEGTVERGAKVRLIRDNVVIHEGELSQLKRFKDDANQVVAGQECGMAFANYQDMREGDVIECYRVEEIARTL
ncbi:MAG: translation initiation factor IF-2 [Hyphomicrobiales bacterium]|nr:translation initiation factor IF-2 [Hyphomicrobiales bacterium]